MKLSGVSIFFGQYAVKISSSHTDTYNLTNVCKSLYFVITAWIRSKRCTLFNDSTYCSRYRALRHLASYYNPTDWALSPLLALLKDLQQTVGNPSWPPLLSLEHLTRNQSHLMDSSEEIVTMMSDRTVTRMNRSLISTLKRWMTRSCIVNLFWKNSKNNRWEIKAFLITLNLTAFSCTRINLATMPNRFESCRELRHFFDMTNITSISQRELVLSLATFRSHIV